MYRVSTSITLEVPAIRTPLLIPGLIAEGKDAEEGGRVSRLVETTKATLQEQVENNPGCNMLDQSEQGSRHRIRILANPIQCHCPS